jgi:hypothetical protein
LIKINDAGSEADAPVFDNDKTTNNQVSVQFMLTHDPGGYLVSLIDEDGEQHPLSSLGVSPQLPDPIPPQPPEPITPQPRNPIAHPKPDPESPKPQPMIECAAGVTPSESDSLDIIYVDGIPRLLVTPTPTADEQPILVCPESFNNGIQRIVETAGGFATQSNVNISFSLIEASLIPLDPYASTAGGGTISSNAPTGFTIAINGVYFSSGAGADEIIGSSGNDFIRAGANDDFIDTGNGDDLICGGTGSDTFITGEGQDLIYYTVDQLDGSSDLVLDFSSLDRIVVDDDILVSLTGNVATFSSIVDGVERTSTLTFGGSSVLSEDFIAEFV